MTLHQGSITGYVAFNVELQRLRSVLRKSLSS